MSYSHGSTAYFTDQCGDQISQFGEVREELLLVQPKITLREPGVPENTSYNFPEMLRQLNAEEIYMAFVGPDERPASPMRSDRAGKATNDIINRIKELTRLDR